MSANSFHIAPASMYYSWTTGSDDTCSHVLDWGTQNVTNSAVSTTWVDVQDYIRWASPKRRRRKAKAEEPVRRPPPLEFNKFLNGSDLLEDFIKFAHGQGVRKQEILSLPVDLFIKWLIVEAAKADQEEPPLQLVLPRSSSKRCLSCKRFVARASQTNLCNAVCAQRYFLKAA